MTRFFWWGYKISFQELVSAEPYCHNTGTVCVSETTEANEHIAFGIWILEISDDMND